MHTVLREIASELSGRLSAIFLRDESGRRAVFGDHEKLQTVVVIPDVITVQELGNRMATRGVDIIKFLMRQGVMLKINDVIDNDTAELVATEFGHTVRRVSEADVESGRLTFVSQQSECII